MLNSFIRCIINDDYFNPLMHYYCYLRMHNLLTMNYSIHNAAISTTPYYETVYITIKKVLHLPGYPLVSKKNSYMSLIPEEKSYAEENFSNIIFNPYEKEIVFKHLHLCLATNQRLAMMS